MKILITEDNFASRNFLQFILKEHGEVDLAVDGREALEAAEMALKQGKPYDIIFMDIMMPGMDGLEATGKIRDLEKKYKIHPHDEVRIVMATALTDVKTVFKAFYKSKATEYITKPYTKEEITAMVTQKRDAHG